ncbi:hypothetical protein HELRODRAFT_99952 [Helobdella robusta]|uniref:Origin recognition complex subunit 2 n=1 Tax=Helobdella robusta TaxID=6412 RepID=T1G9V8_HELRO|nr:hypothetical protein HELRODRAFT_99952 [Helobdella robusta]ESO03670.1 hypothetical protein HELRODRAFT_99952 [Helobdella robusta]
MMRQQLLSDYTCIVVNGFFPSLTLKSVSLLIFKFFLGQENFSGKRLANWLVGWFASNPDVFILLNNIDGTCLRNEKIQNTFSLLCTIKGIHIIATIDHINAPLLWDHNKMSQLNWVWFDCTTFETYSMETSYENSILVQQSGVLVLSSLTHVMKSLTPNARGIFILISKYQLEAKSEHGYQGIAFPDLYLKCREAFLVNSEPTLRTQLVEFKDHKLIKTKKGLDGVECIVIAVEDNTLATFVEQQDQQ